MNIIKQSVSLQENIYLLSSHFDCTIFQYLINFFSILIYFGLKIINSKINYVSMNFQHKLSRLYFKRRSEKQYYTVILPIMSHHVNWYMVRKCYMEGTENDQRQGTKFFRTNFKELMTLLPITPDLVAVRSASRICP